MSLVGPPLGVPAPKLFRQLLQSRPVRQLPFRFVGVDHDPLQVRGLSLLEAQEARDEADDETAAIVAHCVLDAHGARVFRSADEVLDLPEGESVALKSAALGVLDAFCPLPGRSDLVAWRETVAKGARDPSNVTIVGLLGAAYEIAGGISKPRFIDRPERYFGVPLRDLSYAQLLAFRVARSIHEEQHHA